MRISGETCKKDGYYDAELNAHIVSVMAGAFRWTKSADIAFSTMLGSCISICAYDEYSGVGGMNHFLLPQAPAKEKNEYSDSFRYGSAAIENLLNSLYSKGAAKNGIVIKIFGGAKVLDNVSIDIGRQNIDFAHRFFNRENMRIQSEDVGGKCARRIIFFPRTGRVLLRQLDESKDVSSIAQKEMNILKKISRQKQEDEIELF
jgi:chemotaxis protein CheD